jgi:hypothetical protein
MATNVHVASSFSRDDVTFSNPVNMYLAYNNDYTKSKFIPTVAEAGFTTENYYEVRNYTLLGEHFPKGSNTYSRPTKTG